MCRGDLLFHTAQKLVWNLFLNHWQLTPSMAWDWRVSTEPAVSLRRRGLEINNFFLIIRITLHQKCFIMKAKSFWFPSPAFLYYIFSIISYYKHDSSDLAMLLIYHSVTCISLSLHLYAPSFSFFPIALVAKPLIIHFRRHTLGWIL